MAVVARWLLLMRQRHAEQIAVRLEAAAIDVDEDRVGDGDWLLLRVVRPHHDAEPRPLADRRHHQVGVGLEPYRNRMLEPHRVPGEELTLVATGEVQGGLGTAVDKHLHPIDVEPVGALHLHPERNPAVGSRQRLARTGHRCPFGLRCPSGLRRDLQERAARHHEPASLGGLDDVVDTDLSRVVGGARDVVAQPAGTVEGVVGVGVDHARNPIAQVEHLEPAKHGVGSLPRVAVDGRGREDLLQGMHLDHVDETEHRLEPGVGSAIGVSITEHLHEVGVVHLHHLARAVIPESEPFDLGHGIVVVHDRPTAVLGVRMLDEREGILVIDRQEGSGEFHAAAGGHQVRGTEPGEVRLVGRNPVVLRAGGELDVLAEQVLHPAELAAGVVAGGGGVAVEIAADPARRVHRADQPGGQPGLGVAFDGDLGGHHVVLRPVTDEHVVRAGSDLLAKPAVGRVNEVADGRIGAVGGEVGVGTAAAAKLHLAGNRSAGCVADLRHHEAGAGQLERARDSGRARLDRERLLDRTASTFGGGAGPPG